MMKKATLFVLLLIPFYLHAQGNLIGKTRCDINISFQEAKNQRVNSNMYPGAIFSDMFYSGKYEQTVCLYDDMEICTEVVKIMKPVTIAATLKTFNDTYDKADGELMLTNTWVDKAKTFKVHLENWVGVNKVYLDYIAFDKRFVKK